MNVSVTENGVAKVLEENIEIPVEENNEKLVNGNTNYKNGYRRNGNFRQQNGNYRRGLNDGVQKNFKNSFRNPRPR